MAIYVTDSSGNRKKVAGIGKIKEIPNGSITGDKLADDTITTSKFIDDSVTWSKLAVDARPIRKNKLRNPIFVGGGSQQGGGRFPINQRGQTEYQGAGYGLDGWNGRVSNQKIVLTDDCVELHAGANQADFGQPFQVPAEIVGRKWTLSALVKGDGIFAPNIGVLSNTQQGNTAGSPSAEWQLLTTTVTINPYANANGIIRPRIFLSAANSQNPSPVCYIKAAAFEPGDHQTAFSQDADGNWVVNEIPDYGEELAKCQSKYIKFNTYIASGFITTNATEYVMPINLPVSMQANPTIRMRGYYARGINGYSKHTPSGTLVPPTSLRLYKENNHGGSGILIVDRISASVGDTNNTPMEYMIFDLELDLNE